MTQPLNATPPTAPNVDGGNESAGPANAARTLALGALMTGYGSALDGMDSELVGLGIPIWPRPLRWDDRLAQAAASDRVLDTLGVLALVGDVENSAPNLIAGRPRFSAERESVWSTIANGSTDYANIYAWLRLNAAEGDPLLIAASNASLSHFRAPADRSLPVPVFMSKSRDVTALYANQDVGLAGEISRASLNSPGTSALRVDQDDLAGKFPKTFASRRDMSLIIHGTFSYTKPWWHSGGDFHTYIKNSVRPNLYSQGDYFDWSGAYKKKHRRAAAAKLATWLGEKNASAVDTIFGHSYGGAIALMSTAYGIEYETVVLLSTPVHNYEVDWRNIGRTVSLRIHCDLVLLAARARQRFRTNVDEYWLDDWFVAHDLSHDHSIWTAGNWKATLGL